MSTFVKIPFPATSGTLINVYAVKTIIRTSATVITIHFDDATTMACTTTSDSTFNTLKAFNDACAAAKTAKTNPSATVELSGYLPSGISVSAVAVALLA